MEFEYSTDGSPINLPLHSAIPSLSSVDTLLYVDLRPQSMLLDSNVDIPAAFSALSDPPLLSVNPLLCADWLLTIDSLLCNQFAYMTVYFVDPVLLIVPRYSPWMRCSL